MDGPTKIKVSEGPLKKIMEDIMNLDAVDGAFVFVHNGEEKSHLIAFQGMTEGLALEIIFQVLSDLGFDPEPIMYLIERSIQVRDVAQALQRHPPAGGIGRA